MLTQLEDGMSLFDNNLLYNNQTDRGYMILEIQEQEIRAHWRYVDTVNSRDYKVKQSRSTMMRIASKGKKYDYKVR